MAGRSASVPELIKRRVGSATPILAALPTAPGLVRGYVRATLAAWGLGELTDTAEMIASEMTANAVNASASAQAAGDVLVIRVCLLTDGAFLTIECWDQAPGVPVLVAASGLAETGRGLEIVDVLTRGAWGCRHVYGRASKCVWAEISIHDACLAPPVPNGPPTERAAK